MNAPDQALQDTPRDDISEAEWNTRVELAACYRLVARHGWTDQTATHISARVAGEPDAMLLNNWDLFFDEITASSLVKVKLDGSDLANARGINAAGFTIHGAVLAARNDVVSALHTHTPAGMAVSAMACGLLSLTQNAMRFHGRLAYHDYEGIATDQDEGTRLVADLGDKHAMILRNHGLLTCGRSVAEAFSLVYGLEKCCQSQLAAMASGTELVIPPPEVCERTARQFDTIGAMGERDWAAYKRQLDAEEPDYKT